MKCVSILILLDYLFLLFLSSANQANFCVSILILLDYLFLLYNSLNRALKNKMFQSLFYWITYSYFGKCMVLRKMKICFNPYFTGLPILIRSVKKTFYLLLLQSFFQTLKSSFFDFFSDFLLIFYHFP